MRNMKALSPVVASIILITVTVGVSIGVAWWMGALTFSFIETKETIVIAVPQFAGASHAHAWIDLYADSKTPLALPFNLTFRSSLKSFVLKVEYFNQTTYYDSSNVTIYQFLKVGSEQQFIVNLKEA